MNKSVAPEGRRGNAIGGALINANDNIAASRPQVLPHQYDLPLLRAAIVHRTADLYTAVLGEPNRAMSNRRELRFGRKGSVSVALTGPKAGLWHDHENNIGGDFLQLLVQDRNLGFFDAVKLAAEMIGHVAARVALDVEERPARDVANTGTQESAGRIWRASVDPHGTIIDQKYLPSRGLSLPDDVAVDVIRFHPALRFEGALVAAMVCLFRDIVTSQPCGIHRTFLDADGQKIGRKMLGRSGNAAIKLDADENVTLGLHIGEGVETCIAAQLAGFRPVWALGSAGAIGSFPVLSGIDAVTILGETNDGGANQRNAQECAARWMQAGREVLLVEPLIAEDMNAAWREAVS
jgi:Toprim domain